ncbi:MAG: response regulator [Thioploca sp.]|nr:response regulator [Thioploca sp.]
MSDKKVILCVDDEKTILKSLKAQLKKHFSKNYTYECAESAIEALEILEELSKDGVQIMVIVSDWLMPQMKGDEFLVQVHQKFPNITKVMLTGQANEDAIERARREANLGYCIHKPWSEQELIAVLESSLGNT